MRQLIITSMILFSACGRDPQTSQLNEQRQRPFFVVSGGNSSCGTDEHRQRNSPFATGVYRSFIEKIAPHYSVSDIDVLTTCYTDSDTVNFGDIHEPRTIHRQSREDFTQTLIDRVGAEHHLTHIGHSYGGWLALRTSIDLIDSGRDLGHLFTIDPISRETCTFSAPYGCTEAPADIEPDHRTSIAEATAIWKNFYQTQTWYLHSGPMEEADKNVKISTSHSRIDKHDTVWQEILHRVVYQWEDTSEML